MTREEALKQADDVLMFLLQSGDEKIFAAARKADGTVNHTLLVSAALRARERIADKILAGEM